MRAVVLDIIEKKRDGQELTWEEMQDFVKGAQDGNVHPAQIGESPMLTMCFVSSFLALDFSLSDLFLCC